MSKKVHWRNIIVLFFIVLFNGLFFLDAAKETRYDRIFMISIILFFIASVVETHTNRIATSVHRSIFVFSFIYSLYALYTLAAKDFDKITSYLPTILYSTLSFYYFFQNCRIRNRARTLLYFFSSALIIIAFLHFYMTYSHKVELLGDNFYKHSNNVGYFFVLLMPLVWLTFNKERYILLAIMTIFIILVFLSAKRGAVIIGSLSYLYFIVSHFKYTKNNSNRKFLIFLSICALYLASYFIYNNLELLTRFSEINETGGSGRDIIYFSIINGWINSSALEFFLGHGFFSTLDLTHEHLGASLMAHNDFLEVLYDMGVLGVVLYSTMFVMFCCQTKHVRKYSLNSLHIYKLCLLIWVTRSMVGGAVIDKNFLLIFMVMGIILGETMQKKILLNNNSAFCYRKFDRWKKQFIYDKSSYTPQRRQFFRQMD